MPPPNGSPAVHQRRQIRCIPDRPFEGSPRKIHDFYRTRISPRASLFRKGNHRSSLRSHARLPSWLFDFSTMFLLMTILIFLRFLKMRRLQKVPLVKIASDLSEHIWRTHLSRDFVIVNSVIRMVHRTAIFEETYSFLMARHRSVDVPPSL